MTDIGLNLKRKKKQVIKETNYRFAKTKSLCPHSPLTFTTSAGETINREFSFIQSPVSTTATHEHDITHSERVWVSTVAPGSKVHPSLAGHPFSR